jgi:isopenicillin N synthase-like dioxygenase
VHRVWNKNTEDRFSIVFFWDGNLDIKLKPLSEKDQGEKGDESIPTLEEHVRTRMTGSYSVQQK